MAITTSMASDSVAILSCSGRLTMVAAAQLTVAINAAVEAGRTRIVVDLTEVSFIDSSCLGALIAGLKKARHAAGDLRISCAGPAVRTVLSLTNLDRVIPNHATVDVAMADWSSAADG